MIIFNIILLINLIHAEEYCGTSCSYSIPEKILTVEIGWISKIQKFDGSEVIETIKITGNTQFHSTSLSEVLKQFPSVYEVIINSEIIPMGFVANTKIRKITIGKDVERIEERAFENCQTLESVTFNSNSKLSTINDYAFRNCINLKEIQLPKSLEKIDFKKVFENCKEIKIEIEEENEYYRIENDIVYSKNESSIIYYDNKKTESYYSMCNEITTIEIK